MTFMLVLDAYAGSDIADCAAEATRLANILGVTTRFDFNGVECHALPDGCAESLAKRWHEVVGKPPRVLKPMVNNRR
jgi:hypothetical protein